MNDKGLVLTYLAFIMVLFLLVVSFFLIDGKINYKDMETEGLKIYTVSKKHHEIEKMFFVLLKDVGGTKIDSNADSISFSESFPDSASKSNYLDKATQFKNFISLSPANFDITINDEADYLLSTKISPFDLNYSHISPLGLPDYSTIHFYPNHLDFDGYIIDITLQGQDYNSNTQSFFACDECNYPIYLTVIVRDSNGSIVQTINETNIDSSAFSQVIVRTTGSALNDFNISVMPDGRLFVHNNNLTAVDINSTLIFNGQRVERPVPSFPEGFLSIKNKITGTTKN